MSTRTADSIKGSRFKGEKGRIKLNVVRARNSIMFRIHKSNQSDELGRQFAYEHPHGLIQSRK